MLIIPMLLLLILVIYLRVKHTTKRVNDTVDAKSARDGRPSNHWIWRG